MSQQVEEAIFELLAPLAPGKSVSPEDVARKVDPDAWRRALGHVRAVAVGLARQGKLEITRHGKAAHPERFKGVYRLRLPQTSAPDAEAIAAPSGDATEN